MKINKNRVRPVLLRIAVYYYPDRVDDTRVIFDDCRAGRVTRFYDYVGKATAVGERDSALWIVRRRVRNLESFKRFD